MVSAPLSSILQSDGVYWRWGPMGGEKMHFVRKVPYWAALPFVMLCLNMGCPNKRARFNFVTNFVIYFFFHNNNALLKFNNCPTRCDLFNLLYFCKQIYMFRVLTPIIRSWYNCNYSFWYWLTGSTTIRCRCWVETDSCVSLNFIYMGPCIVNRI